ncbi:MAG: 1-(5-phosphoribosyl)-5-[(5-phosphoribosylamino)methylideneamino]imidazole-4-carboxamide isomerase [Bacillota bacterium]|nr:1-(5-phosphoribosyl)-5-[(5-phosphoribosylamino)methylideneamino]imidazole-4-carboxamide isomerase [Bacillota bacterium]
MIILPAIDIKDGTCVRLMRGDYSTAHKVAEDPIKTALSFKKAGASWLHMVDLDGAKDAALVNSELILSVLNATDMNVEVGGGIRDMNAIEFYLSRGIKRVILGSAAIKNPELVKQAVKDFGQSIAVGIDAKDDMVCAEGWTDNSEIDYIELAKKMENIGVNTIIYTDIAKDGMLSGPNLTKIDELRNAVSCNIIASGGVSSVKDIINLAELNIYGAICGKSIYSGELDLKMAVKVAEKV